MFNVQKIKDFFDVAENRLYEKIKDVKRNLIYGVKNLWVWFPVIWNDRNWDHQFIYKVFRYKLHLTEQLIRNNGHHLYHIKDADKIKICVNLLDRLMKDEYHEMTFKNHDKKWGESKFDWIEAKEYPNMTELKITYPNVKTDKDKENEKKDFQRCSKHEAALREQDLDLLFTNMRKHIQGWWD